MSESNKSLAMDAIDHVDEIHQFLDLLVIGLDENQNVNDPTGADRLHMLTLAFLQLALPHLKQTRKCLEEIAKVSHEPFTSPAAVRVGLND